jgi:hypothetical protein
MIIKSSSPDVAIADVPITDYVLRHAERLADKPALIDGPTGRTLTYRQLAEGVRRASAGLAQRGFRKGDVLRDLQPEPARVRGHLPGRRVAGRHQHDANPLYTADELGQAAQGLARALPGHGAAVPRQGEGAAQKAASRRSSCSDRPRAPRRSPI